MSKHLGWTEEEDQWDQHSTINYAFLCSSANTTAQQIYLKMCSVCSIGIKSVTMSLDEWGRMFFTCCPGSSNPTLPSAVMLQEPGLPRKHWVSMCPGSTHCQCTLKTPLGRYTVHLLQWWIVVKPLGKLYLRNPDLAPVETLVNYLLEYAIEVWALVT